MPKITTVSAGDLALVPIQPIAGVIETLAWYTDLHQSQNGTELSLQLRPFPRQGFQFKFPEQAWQKQSAFNTQYAAIAKPWAIPVWTESQNVGAISASSTSITCDTDNYDFRTGGLCFLYQDDSHWQLLDLGTVSSGNIDLYSGETTQAYTNAWIMPCRVGRVVGSVTRAATGINNVSSVTFAIDDNAAIPNSSAPTQYLSDDLYTDPPLESDTGAVSRVVNTRIDITDYDLGPVTQRAPWLFNRVDYQRNVLCATPAEVRTFKQWLQRRAGRLKRFWEPSFDNDLRKQSTGTVTTSFLAANDGVSDWAALGRSHVAFELSDSTWLVRALTSITVISDLQVQLNFAASLAVPASSIRRVSWLGLKRLNADQIELNWQGGGIMQSHIMVTELSP